MHKQVLKLALPSILANITIPLVGLVDTAIVGHVADAVDIGGIAIGTMLFDLLYWNFGFLRVGTSGMTAQAFGRNDKDECSKLLIQALTIALAATVLIWAIQWIFVTAVLACVPCSPEVADFAKRYFFVRIWAAPATLSLMAFKGWFIGMQDTISPMVIDIVVNVVNMVVSYVLAIYTPLGAVGVAHGTVIAQTTGLLVAVGILVGKYRKTIACSQIPDVVKDIAGMKRLLVLNGNLFVRSFCFMVVYVGFTALAAVYGDVELAISSILMKLFMLFSYFVDGFAYAGEALVGRYIGERQSSKVKTAVKVLFVWSLGVGALFTLIYWLSGNQFIRLMTDNTDVLSSCGKYMGWLIGMPLISTLAFMWDGVYVGATAGNEIRNAMIWAAIAFVVCYLLLHNRWGMQALYLAYFAHLGARVVYLQIKWRNLYDRTFGTPSLEGAEK
ncbi:MAG: MATE family efflux transporter [Paludibacteraceae bacterium]|nr:MATE family efflux transporter [Paludibacteraceae bacterium]